MAAAVLVFSVRIVVGVIFVLFGVTGDVRLVVFVGVLGADGLMVRVQKLETAGVAVGQGVNAVNDLDWNLGGESIFVSEVFLP